MELRNATIDKHAASDETTDVQLKSTLHVSAIQHKKKVNPRYRRIARKGRKTGKERPNKHYKVDSLQPKGVSMYHYINAEHSL